MIAKDTRGSRRTLRSFCRPLAELKITCWPSKSTQTGVTCGLPSGINVPRLAKARFWNKSAYFSGMTSDIRPPTELKLQQHYRRMACSKGREPRVNLSFPVTELFLFLGAASRIATLLEFRRLLPGLVHRSPNVFNRSWSSS